MNELHHESSPYLLQHAENPVHWKSWNNKTLSDAKNANKLLLISIGYSTCHWCHVMEHESFEDDEVAKVMNDYFVNIKVDREERPDVDALYMKAVQLMGSQGGWPLNVVALPDGRPIWGGTYFPKNNWLDYLNQLAAMHSKQPEILEEYAQKLHNGIQTISVVTANADATVDSDQLETLLTKWKRSFDHKFGGMAKAPKFMMPNNQQFLLRYAVENNDQSLMDFINLTATKMAYGGLFDTVGGGFSRYSVDFKWHIPHFEKMLYDNAQLISLYSDLYKVTKNEFYREVAEKTINFINEEFSNGKGGYFSALDADSLTNDNKLVEGAFYVWTNTELQDILENDFEMFSQVFNINEFGYWEDQNYVLIQNDSLENIAKKFNLTESELHSKKIVWEKMLYNQRKNRHKPRLDDKSITSWNALMGKSLVDAFTAFGNKDYLESAVECSNFILEKCQPNGDVLYHSYKNEATIVGYLEDYAQTIHFLIGLYQVTFEENYIVTAKELTDYCFNNFYTKSGFFSFSSHLENRLIADHFEIEDNVIPASNSVMARNLLKLSTYFADQNYKKIAQEMILSIVSNIDYPSAYSNWLQAYLELNTSNIELAITSKKAIEIVRELQQHYLPNVTFSGTNSSSELPFLEGRDYKQEDMFYLCRNSTCQAPSGDLTSIKEELKIIS